MYCDCPYGGPCKHLVAVTVTINALLDDFGYDPEEGYTVMSSNLFYSMLERRESIDL